MMLQTMVLLMQPLQITNQYHSGGNLNLFFFTKGAGLSGALLLVAAALPLKSAAEPDAPGAIAAGIGISAMRFDYREYDEAGAILDREQKGIPGISFRIGQQLTGWEWESIASYHQGRVNYTGQTNTGAPYNTFTDETIGDVAVRLGRCFDGTHPWVLFGGLGYRRWDRDILPGTIGGLFESYRWPYLWLGAKVTAFQEERSRLMFDIGLLRPLSPELRVDFEGAYNVSPVVYPESKFGLRMMLNSRIALSEKAFLDMEPYLDYWNLGQSPIVVAGRIAVHEPASRTRNLGINVRLGRAF